MKEILEGLVGKDRVSKQKVMKEKFRKDGKLKKRVERETEFESVSPISPEETEEK